MCFHFAVRFARSGEFALDRLHWGSYHYTFPVLHMTTQWAFSETRAACIILPSWFTTVLLQPSRTVQSQRKALLTGTSVIFPSTPSESELGPAAETSWIQRVTTSVLNWFHKLLQLCSKWQAASDPMQFSESSELFRERTCPVTYHNSVSLLYCR